MNIQKKGRFGAFGGQYVPETLMSALEELESAYAKYSAENPVNCTDKAASVGSGYKCKNYPKH